VAAHRKALLAAQAEQAAAATAALLDQMELLIRAVAAVVDTRPRYILAAPVLLF